MLQIRPNCENCGKQFSPHSEEALICSFECTFCKTCVDEILHNVCPNCTGGFTPRPIRPKENLKKFPASKEKILKPVDHSKQKELIQKFSAIAPKDR